ncbi:MAG: NAD(P)H-binding protein [Actinobacteria bacterium]|nr:NAD(P)H-binding protein [Actinomycetota bacterium]
MPVLVTAADSPLGVLTVRRLLDEGGEVRAYCRGDGPVSELRAAGAIIATGDLDDEGRLEAAMAQVHTVVHLAGGLLSPSAEGVTYEADVVVTAAAQAGVRRLIGLSVPGADPGADEPLRRAKGMAEAAMRSAALPTVVVRPSLVDTPRLRDALAGQRLPAGVLTREAAPLRASDLIELLAQLDALRSEAHEGHVVFSADGPDRMTLAGYLELAGVGDSRLGRRYRAAGSDPLLVPGLDGPWTSEVSDTVFDGWAFTGIRPRPVATPA